MKINEEKRAKFIECAGKRVNNVLHDMQILEPMARSSVYDFTKQDIEEMFSAMQETLDNTRAEFEKKFEEKAKSEKKVFSFGSAAVSQTVESMENVAEMTASVTETVENTAEVIATSIPEITEELASTSADNILVF